MRRSSRITRQTGSRPSNEPLHIQSFVGLEDGDGIPAASRQKTRKRASRAAKIDASDSDAGEHVALSAEPPSKKRKAARSGKDSNDKARLHERLFGNQDKAQPTTNSAACSPPTRLHAVDYHRPLLLDGRPGRASLLDWFDGVSTARSMPWRKAWIDPSRPPRPDDDDAAQDEPLRQRLERRAYEVWISEVMLQQTRVAVVVDYWKRWMARWPTIHDLAAAAPDDVLAAWRGLGYYSRAARVHEAARLVCADPATAGLLPSGAAELAAAVPGVGRYTAGAISAIVFGRAAPMVDGNVLRVLSRQLGVFGDVKSDRAVVDMLWAAADGLVKAVAGDSEDHEVDDASEEQLSDRPGRWGQALMELGSTICTPKPNCAACPISSTCRAYGEGLRLAAWRGLVPRETMPAMGEASTLTDIEDACNFCKPFEEFAQTGDGEEDVGPTPDPDDTTTTTKSKAKPRKQSTLQSFMFTQPTSAKKASKSSSSSSSSSSSPAKLDKAATEVITNHARKFPVKVAKKAVRQEETLVCAVRRRSDGRYLIHRRPQKGLLAGLWEFPSRIVSDPTKEQTPRTRGRDAERYISDLVGFATVTEGRSSSKPPRLRHVGELGSVPWLFSHLKLTMHVHLFELEDPSGQSSGEADGLDADQRRWSDDVEGESMGTGMRKCWALVKEANG